MTRIGPVLALVGSVGATAHSAQAASIDATTYTFTTPTYETVFDDYITPLRYSETMHIEMSVTLDAPLQANLDNASVMPMTWSYHDGVYSEVDTDTLRFNGLVSTDSNGDITGFLMQVYLDAPNTPGVWVRRNTDGDAYATAFAQEVVIGLLDPCAGHSTCAGVPQTRWAQDRATGTGSIAVSSSPANLSSGGQGIGANVSSVPLPAPILLLGACLLGLVSRSHYRARSAPHSS